MTRNSLPIPSQERLDYDTRVEYNISGFAGKGRVRGLATNGITNLGYVYIIEPETNIQSEYYPYTHFVCAAFYLKPIAKPTLEED